MKKALIFLATILLLSLQLPAFAVRDSRYYSYWDEDVDGVWSGNWENFSPGTPHPERIYHKLNLVINSPKQ